MLTCSLQFEADDWNHLTEPVDHRFMTVPVTVRGTLSF